MTLNKAAAFLDFSVVPLCNQGAESNRPGPCVPLTCPFSLVSGFNFFLGTNPRLTKIVTLELHKEIQLVSGRKFIAAA